MQTRRRFRLSTTALGAAGGLILMAGASAALAAAAPPPPPGPVPPPNPARIRAASALPNWSGVWVPMQGDVFDTKAAKAPAGARVHPPFKPAYEAKYAATRAALRKDPKTDPLALCLPLGLLRMMSVTGHYEFTLTPEQVWIFSGTPPGPKSTGAQTRRIYTDGRPQLSGDDLFPTYTGNSVGHWEGDTLVVRTVGLNDGNFIDRTGAELSGDAVVTERIRLTGPNTLEDRFTIDDKTALTGPWTVTRTWRRMPAGTPIWDDSCLGKKVNPADLTDAAVAAKAQGK
ncbi:MAG TPA: hypothetical protein VL460_06215 [Caulobacteraceae bacterium]|nr:hypothetical protein [Caulobacteraceae bacterium]